MGGSQAVLAHDTAGYAVFVPYYPPDLPRSQRIVASCQRVAVATGNALLVIDRAVHAVALAQAFDTQGLGLLGMRDDNEHAGLARCAAPEVATLQDGAKVSSGPWQVPRPEDPRHFGIVAPPAGKTLVDWGTPQVKETVAPIEWPRGYRARSERQENSFKRMMAPGALKTNDGRKKIVGPDRHQHRARAQRAQSLEAAQKRVDKKVEERKTPQDKVAESTSQGPSKRLEQRQRALGRVAKAWKDAQDKRDQLAEQASALGPPRERADRDFRTQTLMTVRTLLLENALMSFLAVL